MRLTNFNYSIRKIQLSIQNDAQQQTFFPAHHTPNHNFIFDLCQPIRPTPQSCARIPLPVSVLFRAIFSTPFHLPHPYPSATLQLLYRSIPGEFNAYADESACRRTDRRPDIVLRAALDRLHMHALAALWRADTDRSCTS